MHLVKLLHQEAGGRSKKIALFILISGAFSTCILAIINEAIHKASERLFLLFILSVLATYVCLKFIFDQMSEIFEEMLAKMRMRLLRKIAKLELRAIEQIPREKIYNLITRESTMIGSAYLDFISTIQSVSLVFFAVLYIAVFSFKASIIIVVMMAIVWIRHRYASKSVQAMLDKKTDLELKLLAMESQLINGFTSVKLNHDRGEELLVALRQATRDSRNIKINASVAYFKDLNASQFLFLLMLGATLFGLPMASSVLTYQLQVLITTLLYIIPFLSSIIENLPILTRANHSALNILEFENFLDRLLPEPVAVGPPILLPVEKLSMHNVFYQYESTLAESFSLGPVDLTVEAGQVLFIIGGNGSGKSTVLKLLTGLYPCHRGEIVVNQTRVDTSALSHYRSLFSVIFNDFTLFEELYSIEEKDLHRVDKYLKKLGLDDKVTLEGNRIRGLKLSTGQRKRLALVVALLEDRPIFVFDEWAADQDPEFRRYFYEAILPELKREGKMIIAVTHDDHYFHTADRILRLEYGKVK